MYLIHAYIALYINSIVTTTRLCGRLLTINQFQVLIWCRAIQSPCRRPQWHLPQLYSHPSNYFTFFFSLPQHCSSFSFYHTKSDKLFKLAKENLALSMCSETQALNLSLKCLSVMILYCGATIFTQLVFTQPNFHAGRKDVRLISTLFVETSLEET